MRNQKLLGEADLKLFALVVLDALARCLYKDVVQSIE